MKMLSRIVVIALFAFSASAFALDAPILAVKTSGLTVTLTWSPVTGATGYRLYYAPYPYAGPNTIGSMDLGNATKFAADLWLGANFYVAVTSYNTSAASVYSNIGMISVTSTTPQGPASTDTLAYAKAMVPGAWTYAGYTCGKLPDPRIQASYFMCPSGGVRGAEDAYISGRKIAYVAKGGWSVAATPNNAAFASVLMNYTTTTSSGGVVDSGAGLLGKSAGLMLYDATSDTIAYYFNSCWLVMKRLADGSNIGVDDSYCQSSTSVKQCQADYDCGKCFYCEKSGSGNVCRYGGEGPYGCYRGWSP